MAKIIFQDIKHNGINKNQFFEKKSLFSDSSPQNVDLKSNQDKKVILNHDSINRTQFYKQRIERTPQLKNKTLIIRKPLIILFLVSLVFCAIYLLGNLKHSVDIIISPKQQIINLDDQNFVAAKNMNNTIEFEIMILSDKKLKKITLTEPKDVSIKANGSITLYNEFSTTTQKLVEGTFLSDSEGKTYQINNTVTIPGYTLAENKIIPGQVSVEIQSFLPGENYNGSPQDFQIISFKGTNKYNKIYGKLKNPIVGGASGLYYTFDDTDKVNIENIAETSLKNDLLEQVKVLFPQEYVLFSGTSTFTYMNNDNYISKTPEAEIEIEGVLSVMLFKKDSLTKNIIKSSLPNLSDDELSEISIIDLEKLDINFNDINQILSKETNSIPLRINGKANLIWNPNTEILKSKLSGIHKNEVLSILRQDKGIETALIKIFPPWYNYLPDDLTKIEITIKK